VHGHSLPDGLGQTLSEWATHDDAGGRQRSASRSTRYTAAFGPRRREGPRRKILRVSRRCAHERRIPKSGSCRGWVTKPYVFEDPLFRPGKRGITGVTP